MKHEHKRRSGGSEGGSEGTVVKHEHKRRGMEEVRDGGNEGGRDLSEWQSGGDGQAFGC